MSILNRPTTMRRLAAGLIGGTVVLSLLFSSALPVLAITKIADVRVAGDKNGSDASIYYQAGADQDTVFILFEYSGASRVARLNVLVKGPNNTELFRSEQRFTGDGTASVAVSGQDVVDAAVRGLDETAGEISAVINQIAADGAGETQVLSLVDSMAAAIMRAEYFLPILDSLEGAAVAEHVILASFALDELYAAADDARNTPPDQVAERKSIIAAVSQDAEELRDAVGKLEAAVGGLGALMLPAMGSGWEFNVSVHVSEGGTSSPAGSADFIVVDQDTMPANRPIEPPDSDQTPGGRSMSGTLATRQARSSAANSPDQAAAAATKSAFSASASDAGGDGGGNTSMGPGSNAMAAAAARRTAAAQNASASDSGDGSSDEFDPFASSQDDANQESVLPGMDARTHLVYPGQDGSSDDPAFAEAPPTWTPVGSGAITRDDGVEDDSGSGPNMLVLSFGVLMLVGIAFWFRRRM